MSSPRAGAASDDGSSLQTPSASSRARRSSPATNRISRLWDRISGSPAADASVVTAALSASAVSSAPRELSAIAVGPAAVPPPTHDHSVSLEVKNVGVSSDANGGPPQVVQPTMMQDGPTSPTPASRTRSQSPYAFPATASSTASISDSRALPAPSSCDHGTTLAVPRLSFSSESCASTAVPLSNRQALEPVVSMSSGRGGSSRRSSLSLDNVPAPRSTTKRAGEDLDVLRMTSMLESERSTTRSIARDKGKSREVERGTTMAVDEAEIEVDDDEACFVDGWEGKVDFISSLPHEIALYILLHLSLSSLISANEVSRVWHQLALDNLVWRDLFHREKRWRIREDLGETTARLPTNQLHSISANVSRRNSVVAKRGKNGDGALGGGGGVSGTRLGRKLSDIMSDLGGLSLTPLAAERRKLTSTQLVAISPPHPSNVEDSVDLSRSPPSTATPRRPASGVVHSPFELLATPQHHLFGTHASSVNLSASIESLPSPSTPGPSRRASSASIPPLGPVPSPSFARVPSAPLFLDWPKLYRDRYLLDRSWAKGAPIMRKLQGHKDSVYCLQFDEEKIITGSRDRTMKVWDTKTGECIRTLSGHTASVLCLQYDSTILVSGSSDSRVLIWDLVGEEGTGAGKWEIKHHLLGHTMGVLDLCFDDEYIVSCSKDTSIRVWHKETGTLYRTLAGHRGPINAVQLLNKKVISASGDSLMKLWDILTGEIIRIFSGHERGLACVQYSPSGKLIASGSNDKSVKIWDAETGACLKTLTGHVDLVRTLAFDETSRRLVSGSYDRTVRVWDLDSGKQLLRFKPHSSLVFDVSFSASKIMSSSHDKTVVILDFGKALDISKFM